MTKPTRPLRSMRPRVFTTGLLAWAMLGAAGCAEDGDGGTDDGDTAADAGETEADDAFDIAEDPASAYTRVDRLGMPGVATALITDKDAYNAGDPTDDGSFVAEITAAVETFHAALDDDVMGAGLTPCAPADCVTAAAPLVVPDTIQIDASMPSGFPNGRRLDDPVMDVVLGLLMLDLQAHPVTTFAELPLNPPANDKAFPDAFPYLAPRHG